ncbi:helix-turn-helix domain-containing protein [Actinoplanes sp. NPDC049599]|uniref:helix-turn-helix domain-containing protein n=1 Tax=Actinoplanes sp. NPDC049599 TaxID=3363903 RepID=UPI0037B487F4
MTEHIGGRVRIWRRRRKLSQATLSGLVGISQGYLSQIENGVRAVERRSTQVALAAALDISVADLLGQNSDPEDPVRARASEAVAAVRVALVNLEVGNVDPPRRAGTELEAAIEQMLDLRQASDHLTLAPMLPGLLRDAASDPAALVRVAYVASACLRSLGYRDLARPAARLAVDAAEELNDPAWSGMASFGYILALPVEATAAAKRVSERTLVSLQRAAGDPDARQMLGQIHLSAALAGATAGKPSEAGAHLAAAEAEALSLGEPPDGRGFFGSFFGPLNVHLWKMSLFAELGEHGRVLELAEGVPVQSIPIANRRQSYYLDRGRALAHGGKRDKEALIALSQAERAAPAPFRLSPITRDTVSTMITRAKRRAVAEDLAAMAHRLGISPT